MKKVASRSNPLLYNTRELQSAAKWLYSFLPGYSSLKDRRPYINYRTTDWLEGYLNPPMRVFEYGSEGSTLSLAERVAHVVSVEHVESFYKLMTARMSRLEITNCIYILRNPAGLPTDNMTPYSGKRFTSE